VSNHELQPPRRVPDIGPLPTADTPDPRPVVDDARFMQNVREALINGYDRLCANCGVGTAGDDMDMHERGCPEFREWEP
jgi:hypothetical protein